MFIKGFFCEKPLGQASEELVDLRRLSITRNACEYSRYKQTSVLLLQVSTYL